MIIFPRIRESKFIMQIIFSHHGERMLLSFDCLDRILECNCATDVGYHNHTVICNNPLPVILYKISSVRSITTVSLGYYVDNE